MYDINSSVLFKSGFSAAQLEAGVKAIRPDAGFTNYQAFVDAENAYGISALYLVSHACEESAWGISLIALNNIFGFNADDSNPAGDASGFVSQAACINYVARFLLAEYLTPDGLYYSGTTLHDVFMHYSSSHDQEATTVASIMNLIASKISVSAPPAPPVTSSSPQQYIVQPGDNMTMIAQRFGMSLQDLENLNSGAGHPAGNFNNIWVGDVLQITESPEYYIVAPGDSLYAIGVRYGVSLAQLENLNPNAGHPAGNFNVIWVGDRIRIK